MFISRYITRPIKPLMPITLAGVLLITSALFSAEIEGIFFKDEYFTEGKQLKIRGYGILNYMLVIKAYAGALYLEPGTPPEQALSNRARILELHYFHTIKAADFREATIKMMRRNTNPAEFRAISDRVNRFNTFYKQVNPGDRYRAEHIPGKGTTLYLNGKALGTVKGHDFSRAFFSIWIGRDPIDKKFRDKLLGKN